MNNNILKTILLVCIVQYAMSQKLLISAQLPVFNLVSETAKLTDMNQCIADAAKAAQDVEATVKSEPANIIDVAKTLFLYTGIVSNCSGIFVEFNDTCKADANDLMKINQQLYQDYENYDLGTI